MYKKNVYFDSLSHMFSSNSIWSRCQALSMRKDIMLTGTVVESAPGGWYEVEGVKSIQLERKNFSHPCSSFIYLFKVTLISDYLNSVHAEFVNMFFCSCFWNISVLCQNVSLEQVPPSFVFFFFNLFIVACMNMSKRLFTRTWTTCQWLHNWGNQYSIF